MFLDKGRFIKAYLERVESMYGKNINEATKIELYMVLGSMVKEHMSKNWVLTKKSYRERGEKQVYYFSIEFLMGRMLGTNLINLGIKQVCEEGLHELGISFEEIEQEEPDPGLGNGGLGRLASCFLDSMASLQLPGNGCGIRYKYGLFEQKIMDGYQVELPDYWLQEGNVWEFRRSDKAIEVRFGGNVWCEQVGDRLLFHHHHYESVLAVPYDVPIPGYHNNTVNTLRLWNAESAIKDFDFQCLNNRDYHKIVEYKRSTEAISEFLYPDDSTLEGRMLRLKQQYFLVSAGLQSIIRSFKKRYQDIREIPNKVAIHINDTHPVLSIPELMRILMDEEGLEWDEAWSITTKVISYTNHTTLEEALERWPIDIMKLLLPRIYLIIEEINERFCRHLWNKYPGEWGLIHEMAIVADGQVKMAHLAIVGSYQVNGVSKVHTEILKKKVMKNFYHDTPYKFHNRTNGITHRRWLLKANPALSKLVSETITPNWIEHPSDLNYLLNYVNDTPFQENISQIKRNNKIQLSNYINEKYQIKVDPESIFDVQVKRLHAYKRQLLNVFHIMDLYNRLKEDPNLDVLPRTFIFGAKAAPSYFLAKKIIKLINTVARTINNDPIIQGKIKLIFIENYGVTLAEKIIPAADIGEQISTASKEASGTGNMKFMMNGALTLGTLDGANIEIKEEVGDENVFIFGLTSAEVLNYYEFGGYRARDLYQGDPRLRKILDQLINGFFQKEEVEFKNIYYSLLTENDEFFVLKDFGSYVDAHQRIDQCYRNRKDWIKKSIINIAHSGVFSSDRTILEYATGNWEIRPVFIP